MTTQNDKDTLHLMLTVRRGVTVFPRCLQILSRRGFTLLRLTTSKTPGDYVVMHLTVEGPARWHEKLIHLLQRPVDVELVQAREKPHA